VARFREPLDGPYELVGADALEAVDTRCVTPDVSYQLGHLQGEPGPCPAEPCSLLDCYRRRVAAYEAGEPVTVSSCSLPRPVRRQVRLTGLLAVWPDGTMTTAENVEP